MKASSKKTFIGNNKGMKAEVGSKKIPVTNPSGRSAQSMRLVRRKLTK